LKAHTEEVQKLHLRNLMQDADRCKKLTASFGKEKEHSMYLDYSRQQVTDETMGLLFKLAKSQNLTQKIQDMANGVHLNSTEDRAVMHMALRAPAGATFEVDGENVVPKVQSVLDRIESFANKVRGGQLLGVTGKPLTDVVSIGIGGSYLGPEFLAEALKTDSVASKASAGRRLRFLANVDPVDVKRATAGLNPETTLVIVCSKTFTTAETMLNARTVRAWLVDGLKGAAGATPQQISSQHIVACSANVKLAGEFGILEENVFGFWDWVGGRYSVCSAIGMLPISVQYGPAVAKSFLSGAAEMDGHFVSAPLEENLPVIMGLTSVWNSSFLNYSARALLPYSQALLRFAAHIQQVDMESNGKRVTLDGTVAPIQFGEINFGEPGTNGQHSFYQLIHQGRVIPCDFIGCCKSQQPVDRTTDAANPEVVSNHDELMSNFFAQPDALACGRTVEELKAENVPERLWAHKEFPGNRPSLSLLLTSLDAYALGQLLSLYEHRTAVQGFVWGINSFDQWGVELGKVLAKKVRSSLSKKRKREGEFDGFNSSTRALLEKYIGSD
jgi:glucose-6-phosphate isomerase